MSGKNKKKTNKKRRKPAYKISLSKNNTGPLGPDELTDDALVEFFLRGYRSKLQSIIDDPDSYMDFLMDVLDETGYLADEPEILSIEIPEHIVLEHFEEEERETRKSFDMTSEPTDSEVQEKSEDLFCNTFYRLIDNGMRNLICEGLVSVASRARKDRNRKMLADAAANLLIINDDEHRDMWIYLPVCAIVYGRVGECIAHRGELLDKLEKKIRDEGLDENLTEEQLEELIAQNPEFEELLEDEAMDEFMIGCQAIRRGHLEFDILSLDDTQFVTQALSEFPPEFFIQDPDERDLDKEDQLASVFKNTIMPQLVSTIDPLTIKLLDKQVTELLDNETMMEDFGPFLQLLKMVLQTPEAPNATAHIKYLSIVRRYINE